MTALKNTAFVTLTALLIGVISFPAEAVTLTPWVDGIAAKNHNSRGTGFNGYSHGVAAGIDMHLCDSVTLKIGYAHTETDVKSNKNKTNIIGDNYFVYGKYKPSQWYISGLFNYGHGDYKNRINGQLNSTYNVDTYIGEILAGFERPFVNNYSGFRYATIRPDAPDAKNTQVVTAVIGTQIHKTYQLTDWLAATPELRMAGTYDLKSDDGRATVYVPGSYTVYGAGERRLRRPAFEAGIGLGLEAAGLKLSLDYDINWRTANFAQGGKIRLQYAF